MLNSRSRAITVSDHTTGRGERRITVAYALTEDNQVLQDLHSGVQLLVDEARAALAPPAESEPEPEPEPEEPEPDPEPDPES